MQINSRFIENDNLGQLHVVSFAPEEVGATNEQSLLFNSLNGRITTIDSFGFAHKFAEVTGTPTHFIERPGIGNSTLPEDAGLRRDLLTHGFVAVSGAIIEALDENIPGLRSAEIRSSGFSLGGAVAALALRDLPGRAVAHEGFDEPALIDTNDKLGTGRFLTYTGLAELAQRASIAPSTKKIFAVYGAEFNRFLLETRLVDKGKLTGDTKTVERREVMRTTSADGLRAIQATMNHAAEHSRPYELRLGFSNMRVVTDHQVTRFVNKMADEFDKTHGLESSVKYGFLWGGKMGRWHHETNRPEAVEALVGAPVESLQRRLG